MTITLPPDEEKRVRLLMESGQFDSVEDLIGQSLRFAEFYTKQPNEASRRALREVEDGQLKAFDSFEDFKAYIDAL